MKEVTEEDNTINEEREQSPNECPPRFLGTCRFLAKASLCLSILELVILHKLSMNVPKDMMNWVIFIVPLALLALCLVLWFASRLLAFYQDIHSKERPLPTGFNYGGLVIFFCTIFCMIAFRLGPYALVTIMSMISGN